MGVKCASMGVLLINWLLAGKNTALHTIITREVKDAVAMTGEA